MLLAFATSKAIWLIPIKFAQCFSNLMQNTASPKRIHYVRENAASKQVKKK